MAEKCLASFLWDQRKASEILEIPEVFTGGEVECVTVLSYLCAMINHSQSSDTIVALATSPGTNGAIAVIRLSGDDAVRITNEVFHGKDLSKQATHTLHFGTIREGKEVIDEVLVSLFIAPHSYTKEHVVEISTHNSKYIIERIIGLLIKKGARAANAGEFTMHL